MKLPRSSGVQLHPTSLPGGRLGSEAHRFVDWLAEAGQSWWQMLPLGPPDRHGSPYRSASAFAAWRGLLAEPRARVTPAEELDFRERNAYWIEDWARLGPRGAVADQVRFEREWSALRAHAMERGVRLIGDVPIYVAAGSVDHRAHPELFRSDAVAGTPPDAYTDKGQLWGNPLYDWGALQRRGYRWWTDRLRRTFELFDLARIDHFRGFADFWAIPESASDARAGEWLPGPREALFRAAEAALGPLPVIAEDLGLITPDVEELRDLLGFPGMVVILWAVGQNEASASPHRFENHRQHQVIYTTTHDTDTLKGHFPGREPWELIELALASRPALCMIPAQDVLGLGSEARMNTPGEPLGNWAWRLEHGQLTDALAERLRAATEATGRLAR